MQRGIYKNIEGDTLYQAIEEGDFKKVTELLKTDINLNQNYCIQALFHQTYLGLAVEKNNGEIIDLLLKNGAIPNSKAIEGALSKREWDLSVKLIEHAYDIKLDMVKVFQNNVPIEETNKILDAIIRIGTDVEKMKDNWHSTLLQFPLHQNNELAIRKLVENGVNLNAPIHSDFLVGLPVIDYGLLLNIDRTTLEFLRQLKSDSDLQIRLMQDNFKKILQGILERVDLKNLGPVGKKRISEKIEQIKAIVLQPDQHLSIDVFRKVQARVLHVLNNPVSLKPTLIAKILDKNNIRNNNSLENSSAFSEGVPGNVAQIIEDKINKLKKDDVAKLKPIYKLVEELNQEISRNRRNRVMSFDYRNGRVDIGPRELYMK
jgi:hypothetical protein